MDKRSSCGRSVDDRAETEAFVERFPAGEKAFFDRSLISQVAIAGWTRQTPGRRLGAFENGRLVALLSIIPGAGWVSHVGEMRLVVAPEARGKGVAGLLLERSNDLAHDLELSKLTIEVAAVHERLVTMFTEPGSCRRRSSRTTFERRQGPAPIC